MAQLSSGMIRIRSVNKMIFVGCDFHSRYQQIACVDTDTGDLIERRLEHENGEARAFYSCLSLAARVGVEATGNLPWFGRMLAELGHESIVGDAAKIRAMVVRRQKADSRDARLDRSVPADLAYSVKILVSRSVC